MKELIKKVAKMPSLLTTRETAVVFRVTVATVKKWAETGELKSFRVTPQGDFRIDRDSVLAKIKGQP